MHSHGNLLWSWYLDVCLGKYSKYNILSLLFSKSHLYITSRLEAELQLNIRTTIVTSCVWVQFSLE